jgi:hypothetical protein
MTAKVKIVKTNVKEILDSMSGDRLGRAVMAGGFVLETAVKVSMAAQSHSGRVYTRKKHTHQASAPGETPAVDFGNYINSIATQLASSNQTEAFAEVGTGAEQALRLEFGFMGRDSIGRLYNQLPRPHFRPAYDNNIEKIKATIQRFAKQQIESAAK